MRLNAEVNSGAAYLMSLTSVVILGVALKAPFTEVFVSIASLYGWHTGRRLWRQLKCGTMEDTNGNSTPQAK
jgi:hypothetical protein